MAVTLQNVRYCQNGSVYQSWVSPNAGHYLKCGYDGSSYWVTQLKINVTTAINTITLNCSANTENTSASYQLRWGISSSETEQMNNRGGSAAGTTCGSIRFSNGTWSSHSFTSGSLWLPAGTYYISIWNGTAGYGDYSEIISYSNSPISLTNTTATTYTISYNANGGSGAPSSQTKVYNRNLTLSSTKPTKSSTSSSCTITYNANGGSVSPNSATSSRTTSYAFSSWNTAAGGGGTTYSAGGTYSTNAAATLYAQWSSSTGAYSAVTLPTPTRSSVSASCTITYNANGGSCDTASATSTKTTTYTFKGWSTSSSATSGSTGSYTPTGSVTLYATWSSTIGAYSAVTLPTATRTGYTFVGWATSNTATSGSTGSYTPTGNVTLYAVWAVNSYYLDVNTYVDGSYLANFPGTFDVYINNNLAASGMSDYYTQHPYGTTYTVKNIKINNGYTYNGETSYSGTIKANSAVKLNISKQVFTLSLTTSNGVTVAVNRTSSPIGGAATGDLTNGAAIYYNDVLKITFTPDTDYNISISTVNGVAISTNYSHVVTANTTIIIKAELSYTRYTLTLSPSANSAIQVERLSTQQSGAALGAVLNGEYIYPSDQLKVTYSYKQGYIVKSCLLNNTVIAMGDTFSPTANTTITTTVKEFLTKQFTPYISQSKQMKKSYFFLRKNGEWIFCRCYLGHEEYEALYLAGQPLFTNNEQYYVSEYAI